MTLDVTIYTDPACPFAFSAEPARQRLRWHYGDQLRWAVRLIVLTLEPGEAEKLARGAPGLQRKYGMPIDPHPYPRPASSEPACRAVVAARLRAPGREISLLRHLRVRTMAGGLIDAPELIDAAARDIGLDPADLRQWMDEPEVEEALAADIAAARSPSAAARALDHKLGGPPGERRYTAPSVIVTRPEDGRRASIPGFNPVEVYETAIANLAPELERGPRPHSVEKVLAWATEPLATAEVAAVLQIDIEMARKALIRTARFEPAGADGYWTSAS